LLQFFLVYFQVGFRPPLFLAIPILAIAVTNSHSALCSASCSIFYFSINSTASFFFSRCFVFPNVWRPLFVVRKTAPKHKLWSSFLTWGHASFCVFSHIWRQTLIPPRRWPKAILVLSDQITAFHCSNVQSLYRRANYSRTSFIALVNPGFIVPLTLWTLCALRIFCTGVAEIPISIPIWTIVLYLPSIEVQTFSIALSTFSCVQTVRRPDFGASSIYFKKICRQIVGL
jgi:hypothetical protein